MAKRGINWDEVPLGRVPDDDLARRYGVTRQAVQKQRTARGIAAAIDSLPGARPRLPLTDIEREDRVELERALQVLLDGSRRDLTVAVATTVGRVPGWEVEARQRLGRGGRPVAFKVRAPGRRGMTEWMSPGRARLWLLEAGWVDAANDRLADLNQRASTTTEEHRAA